MDLSWLIQLYQKKIHQSNQSLQCSLRKKIQKMLLRHQPLRKQIILLTIMLLQCCQAKKVSYAIRLIKNPYNGQSRLSTNKLRKNNKVDEKLIRFITKESMNLNLENKSVDSSSKNSENEDYEDDFEDYESDFESDNSVSVSIKSHDTTSTNVANDTETKFSLQICVEEKVEPFLDEIFEINQLELNIEKGLSNFKTAKIRQLEIEAKNKIKTRGDILMDMIKLDTVSYSLFELPAIPYKQYMQIYGRSNTSQVYSQTNDDNVDKEIQTSEIFLIEKWTQRPIVLPNKMNCSSAEYYQAKLGVGNGNNELGDSFGSRRTNTVDAERICIVGYHILRYLERRAMDNLQYNLTPNEIPISEGHISPSISNIQLIADQPVTSIEFIRIKSFKSSESLVTIHKVKGKTNNWNSIICIWNTPDLEKMPEYILKCPNQQTSLCALPKHSEEGYVVASHIDGSLCVWDLKENKLYHENLPDIHCSLRSPSYNTALIFDQSHKSKVVDLRVVTYNTVKYTEEEFPNELCSLDEELVLIVWTIIDDWTDKSEISRIKYAGTSPWSSVRLIKLQTILVSNNIPKAILSCETATSMYLSDSQDVIIGTNSGIIFRCNLGGHKVWPSFYTQGNTEKCTEIKWLDMCPFDPLYFLVACSINEVLLYNITHQEPLAKFLGSSDDLCPTPIVKVCWCKGHPGIFFAIDANSNVHMWDLCDENCNEPLFTINLPGRNINGLSLLNTECGQKSVYMGLAFNDGKVEMHKIKIQNRSSDKCTDYKSLLLYNLSRL
ncbi:cytoplasmic dynein 2 intermediate chain 1 isoform X2 [Daktulosphaira vitifoliae]|uniref:cytoplasmic dynein 2 intermediate chain 1 isoform X2 n=2 Tax=Daktulosphaira vitifoliae TaxID=58002 RepID=UPI0021AA6B53|nr:cytoplasmic dynein 2 intermediate chain 1 isoform X2 [Daktulosphaira vitifoliae]